MTLAGSPKQLMINYLRTAVPPRLDNQKAACSTQTKQMYKIYFDPFVQPQGRTKKLLMVMKLTTFLLLFAIMQVSAMTYAQKVSLKVKNSPLSNVLDQISDQTGYNFFYSNSTLNDTKPVSLSVKNMELSDVLEQLFADESLGFTIQEKTVVIKEKERSLTDNSKAQVKPAFAPVLISGIVTDEHGNTLSGVTIRLKGTKLAWTTNQRGAFVADIIPQNAILQFFYIGYLTQEIPLNQLKNPATIVMKEDISKLDEVQVIAYGTTTKRANTGDVTVIDSKTISKYPTINVLDVLQGTVPGVVVYKNTGNITSTYKVQIRGMNGLPSAADPYGGQPLYVIDGVPFQGGAETSLNTTSGSHSANGVGNKAYDAMSLINPDDIQSISILKDADATAIYGSRGSDGVILITTKKGKAGPATIDASVYSGVNDRAREVPLLNLQQYLQMRTEAKKNDNTTIGAGDYDLNGVWDQSRGTDWQKALTGGFGHTTNAHVGISGGSDLIQYRISSGYNYISNLEHLGGSDRSANLNFSITSTTSNHKFTASFTGGYLYDNNTTPQTDLTAIAVTLAPDAPALYTPEGLLNFQNINGPNTPSFSNPLVAKNYLNNSARTNLTSNLVLSYRPFPSLEIKLSSGYNKQDLNEFLGSPTSAIYPAIGTSSSTFTFDNTYSWSIEPQANYTKQIGKGTLNATLGASLQKQVSDDMALSGSGYATDLLLSSLTAGTTITTAVPYSVFPKKNGATFGRISYNWDNKYYLNFSGRDDGSSSFGQDRQFHLFAALGVGWIFSEENLIKDNLPFLSFGKLRGSYGSTGRDILTPYSYLSTYTSTAYNSTNTAYAGVPSLSPTSLPNPELQWESTKKAEIGLELQFLKGRIAFETNIYRNRTTNLLTAATLPAVTGFPSINTNQPGTIQDAGFDATLTTHNIRNKNFSWTTTILFTRDRNKLISYPGLANSAYAHTLIIGQPVNIIQALRLDGVNPQTGLYQFIAANGSVTGSPNTTNNADNTVLINTNPDFYGSVQNNITYKQFTFSFLFRYMKETGRNGFGNIQNPPGLTAYNQLAMVTNRWQKPGDITNIQRYGSNLFSVLFTQAYAESSNAAYGDASYIRLQNASLSYSLPQALAHKIGMHNMQVFVNGDNLLTITGYYGADPETQSIATLPPLRTIAAGLRLTL